MPNKTTTHFRRIRIIGLLLLLAGAVVIFYNPLAQRIKARITHMQNSKTVQDRLDQYGETVRQRLSPLFKKAGVTYPASKLVFIGLKEEKQLEIWAAGADNIYRRIHTYPILGTSGVLGPKLHEGDRQVPEGIYKIESLNPNSRFHLSLRVNYPNAFDRQMAKKQKRSNLGGDIMIHGNTCSIGCLAMGDDAAEDLFVMAADSGIDNIKVILSPVDFRTRSLPQSLPEMPPWTSQLYQTIKTELSGFRAGDNQ